LEPGMPARAGLPLRDPGLGAPPPGKVNYRSIGRGNGGVIKKRIPIYVKDVDPATPSSVPTKYQTVLYRKNRERQGFSCNTPRFSRPRTMAEVVPGPGTYAGETQLPSEVLDSASQVTSSTATASSQVAAKGRGPFASRTPRLVHPSKQHGYVPPGPGSYLSRDLPRDNSPTAAFSLPGPGNPAKFFVEPQPGPGCYLGPDDAVPPIGATGARAVFGSSPRSTQQVMNPDLPGPGQYGQADDERTRSPRKNSRKQLSPRHEPLLDPEAAQLKKGAELLKSGQAPPDPSSPGPGKYSPSLEAIRGPRQFNARGHSSFHLGNSDRPRSWRPPEPGPSDYVPRIGESRPRDAPWPLSTMASQTERFSKEAIGVPGPAFYSPRKEPEAVSFHLNLQQTWV